MFFCMCLLIHVKYIILTVTFYFIALIKCTVHNLSVNILYYKYISILIKLSNIKSSAID